MLVANGRRASAITTPQAILRNTRCSAYSVCLSLAVKTSHSFNCAGCDRERSVADIPADEHDRACKLLLAVFQHKPSRMRIRGRWVVFPAIG